MVQTTDNVAQAIFRYRLWEEQISARKYEKNNELLQFTVVCDCMLVY